MRLFTVLPLCCLCSCEKQTGSMAKETPTPFDTSKGAETATYEEVIDYINLAKEFPEINIQAMGSL